MPELPEVETTRRGIAPVVEGATVTAVVVRDARLRWPVPRGLSQRLSGRKVHALRRRAKYLLFDFDDGSLIVHLGMSGSLRVMKSSAKPGPHDHVDFVFGDTLLRLRDPRRFGAVLWQKGDASHHPLLAHLGVEPLEDAFCGDYLYRATRRRTVAIKQLLMNHTIVVGVGNIYASESLFRARINPRTAASRLSRARCDALVRAVKDTLEDALRAGGSTLRDFVGSDGAAGYFQLQTFVYDRAGEPCRACTRPIRWLRQGQRSTYFCPSCQR
jgi:formamidopyrimidine-DNA glycosylase